MHTIKLNNKIIVDLTKYSSMAKYVNYSCDSNYQIAVSFVNRILRIGIFTIRNINTNKELTLDYK